jgi:hypothetical protein
MKEKVFGPGFVLYPGLVRQVPGDLSKAQAETFVNEGKADWLNGEPARLVETATNEPEARRATVEPKRRKRKG